MRTRGKLEMERTQLVGRAKSGGRFNRSSLPAHSPFDKGDGLRAVDAVALQPAVVVCPGIGWAEAWGGIPGWGDLSIGCLAYEERRRN